MGILLKNRLAALLGVAFAFGLSACGGEPCFLTQRTMHLEANNAPERQADGTLRHPKPFDVWIDDPDLAQKAARSLQVVGLAEVISHNQLQCTPRPVAGCTDCLTCTGRIRRTEYAYGKKPLMCDYVGDAVVHLEVGPGPGVQAKALYTKR